MAKGTSTSRCPEVVFGCSVRPDKFLTNDGFRIGFSVVCTGFLPDYDYVRGVTKKLEKYLAVLLADEISARRLDAASPDLFSLVRDEKVDF